MGTFLVDFYSPYTFVLAMAVPLTTMMFCYARMLRALNESRKMFGGGSQSESGKESSGSSSVHKLRMAQMNIFQTCFIMIVFFLVAWVTQKSAVFLFVIHYYKGLNNQHYALGNLGILFNSCVNPYIYAVRYDDFKNQIRVLLGFKEQQQIMSRGTTNMTLSKI